MPSLDEVANRLRIASGADFVFVLSRRGRVVTRDAPREMPEIGRAKLLSAALGTTDEAPVAEVTLPRCELVPYGGAAPVDVFVATAADHAVVCAVMASWTDKHPVLPAMDAALDELEELLDGVTDAREKKRKSAPPKKATKEKTPTLSGLVHLTNGAATAAPKLKQGPRISLSQAVPMGFNRPMESLPEIVLGTAPLGRETLNAIEAEQRTRKATPASSMPDIRVELVSMGRDTEVSLRLEEAKRMQSLASAPVADHLVAPAAHRLTQPWAEPAADAKRAADAARRNRNLAPPRVTLKLEDADDQVIEALLLDAELESEVVPVAPKSEPKPKKASKTPTPAQARATKMNSDSWRDAIHEALVAPDAKAGGSRPPPKAKARQDRRE